MSDGDYSPKANKTDLESLQSAVNNQSAAISTKANQTDLDNLKTDVTSQGIAISTKAEQADLLITNQSVATAQTTANQAETDAQTAIAKATEAQANSLPLTGNAVSASKLVTARKLGVSLQASAFQNFDGTVDVNNIGVQGVLPIANGGTGTNDGVINTVAYANSADGADGFTTVYPNLNLLKGTRVPNSLAGNNQTNQTNLLYWFDNGKTVQNQGLLVGDTLTCEFDWTVANPNSGSFYIQLSGTNWQRISQIISITSGNKNGHSKFNFVVDAGFLGGSANAIRLRADYLPTDSVITISNVYFTKGSTATPWMSSVSEVKTSDYPKYVGFSNIIKPTKTYSDYKWIPMGLVSIDSATGLLKPATIGVDYAQPHPIGSVVSNSSSSSSGYTTGTWQNVGSAVIGSTTIYYWKRTA